MAAGTMANASTPEPVGTKPLWRHPGWHLPALIQHVANDLKEKGRPESAAIRLAIGIVRNWSEGHDGKGGKMRPETVAAARKAMAEWESLRARAAASRAKNLTAAKARRIVDLASKPGQRYRHGWIPISGAAADTVRSLGAGVVVHPKHNNGAEHVTHWDVHVNGEHVGRVKNTGRGTTVTAVRKHPAPDDMRRIGHGFRSVHAAASWIAKGKK